MTELQSVNELLTDAFLDDPVFAWAFPDAELRPTVLSLVIHRLIHDGAVRTLIVDGHLHAAAVWSQPADTAVTDQSDAEPPAILLPYLDRLAAIAQATAAGHPKDGTARHLQLIGVRSLDRGRGFGGALLSAGLAEADAAGAAVYLEASSRRSAGLYARHGFVAQGEPVHLPGGPTIHPMLRPTSMINNFADPDQFKESRP